MNNSFPVLPQLPPRRNSRKGRASKVNTSNPLLEITGSKARSEILRILFGLSNVELYVNEIVRLSGLAQQGVDEQLRIFQDLGLVVSRPDGNRRYYQANTGHPFYNDLRSMVLKSTGMREIILDTLKNPKIELAFVFGSIARKEERADSDIDLFIIGEVGLREMASDLRPLTEKLGRLVNTVFFNRSEIARRLENKDHFFSQVIASQKLFIIGTESKLEQLIESINSNPSP